MCKVKRFIGWFIVSVIVIALIIGARFAIHYMFEKGWEQGLINLGCYVGAWAALFIFLRFTVWCFESCEE